MSTKYKVTTREEAYLPQSAGIDVFTRLNQKEAMIEPLKYNPHLAGGLLF
ncbi:hypothetical protein J2X31_001258 [Flavobacterium arsenatis]|uniref:Uncharacterized protein n=1 Tax=Flavobacterium arsenatis TaxID=1484332 RepID=A0ABU1TMR7_9FLAO|nr:hypothetical protein [Flavobacterium arsenatis]MDR6967251.1 hypothetical protein [Flavobacterium arsenatis]